MVLAFDTEHVVRAQWRQCGFYGGGVDGQAVVVGHECEQVTGEGREPRRSGIGTAVDLDMIDTGVVAFGVVVAEIAFDHREVAAHRGPRVRYQASRESQQSLEMHKTAFGLVGRHFFDVYIGLRAGTGDGDRRHPLGQCESQTAEFVRCRRIARVANLCVAARAAWGIQCVQQRERRHAECRGGEFDRVVLQHVVDEHATAQDEIRRLAEQLCEPCIEQGFGNSEGVAGPCRRHRRRGVEQQRDALRVRDAVAWRIADLRFDRCGLLVEHRQCSGRAVDVALCDLVGRFGDTEIGDGIPQVRQIVDERLHDGTLRGWHGVNGLVAGLEDGDAIDHVARVDRLARAVVGVAVGVEAIGAQRILAPERGDARTEQVVAQAAFKTITEQRGQCLALGEALEHRLGGAHTLRRQVEVVGGARGRVVGQIAAAQDRRGRGVAHRWHQHVAEAFARAQGVGLEILDEAPGADMDTMIDRGLVVVIATRAQTREASRGL